MHKWAIPLAWVVGVGAAIGPGAMATMSCGQCGVFHFGLGRTRTGSNEYYVNLAYHIIAFVLPWVILMLPFLALFMQVTTITLLNTVGVNRNCTLIFVNLSAQGASI